MGLALFSPLGTGGGRRRGGLMLDSVRQNHKFMDELVKLADE